MLMMMMMMKPCYCVCKRLCIERERSEIFYLWFFFSLFDFHPPDTGGINATSDVSVITSSSSANCWLMAIRHAGSTACNEGYACANATRRSRVVIDDSESDEHDEDDEVEVEFFSLVDKLFPFTSTHTDDAPMTSFGAAKRSIVIFISTHTYK